MVAGPRRLRKVPTLLVMGRGPVWCMRAGMLVLVVALALAVLPARGASAAAPSRPRVAALRGIALGDSFSSGVGALPAQTTCGRSWQVWSAKAFRSPLLLPSFYSPVSYTQAACAGTIVRMVMESQVPEVNETHNVATLTIGLNDIGFTGIIGRCVGGACPPNVFSVFASSNGTMNWALLESNFVGLYTAIRERMAVDGHLYVLTYPIFFGVSDRNCNGFTRIEQEAFNALVTRLDDTIVRSVERVNSTMRAPRPGNVHVIDWRIPQNQRIIGGYVVPAGYRGAGTRFDTYDDQAFGMCNTQGNEPSVQGVNGVFFGNSFHPTPTAYSRMALRLLGSIRTFQPPVTG